MQQHTEDEHDTTELLDELTDRLQELEEIAADAHRLDRDKCTSRQFVDDDDRIHPEDDDEYWSDWCDIHATLTQNWQSVDSIDIELPETKFNKDPDEEVTRVSSGSISYGRPITYDDAWQGVRVELYNTDEKVGEVFTRHYEDGEILIQIWVDELDNSPAQYEYPRWDVADIHPSDWREVLAEMLADCE